MRHTRAALTNLPIVRWTLGPTPSVAKDGPDRVAQFVHENRDLRFMYDSELRMAYERWTTATPKIVTTCGNPYCVEGNLVDADPVQRCPECDPNRAAERPPEPRLGRICDWPRNDQLRHGRGGRPRGGMTADSNESSTVRASRLPALRSPEPIRGRFGTKPAEAQTSAREHVREKGHATTDRRLRPRDPSRRTSNRGTRPRHSEQ
jgi:hypothetical protein